MSKPPRCHDCNHRRKRVVTATSKRRSSVPGKARAHKKPCHCACHTPAERSHHGRMPGWWEDYEAVS